jgi:hypothetical protein
VVEWWILKFLGMMGKISEKEYPWLKNQHLNLTEKSLITIIFSACETVFHF